MKKMYKIVISAIICMALILVPMTVMAEEGVTYNINYETNLTVGTSNYAVDSTVPYTVYILYPSQVGDYTITSDAKLGIVSYLDMWVQFEPTEENVNQNEITWTCTDVNQAIMIAVDSDLAEVSITVGVKDSTVVEIPWTIYENTKTPEKFEMPDFVNVDAFDDGYVDFEDDVIDDAVLGDDGYYHLNDKNGPVLFANLNDSIMSLYTMSGYGSIAAVYYDENGDITKKVDYTDAFYEYVSALPTDSQGAITSYYYPLTQDLIEIFKEVGATHDWYSGDTPWVYASEDAWLYACYFDKDVTSMGTVDDDNNDNTGDNTTDGETGDDTTNNNPSDDSNSTTGGTTNNDSNTDTSTTAPATGDSVASLAVAMLSAAALVIGAKAKK